MTHYTVLTVHTQCSKKGATKITLVTSLNLNQSSFFFITGKRTKFPIKPMYYFPPHLNNRAALPLGS